MRSGTNQRIGEKKAVPILRDGYKEKRVSVYYFVKTKV